MKLSIRLIVIMLMLATLAAPLHAEEDRPWYQLGMMADPILDQVLLFYLSHTVQGTSDIGECLDTAARVDPDDPWSWANEWTATADRLSNAGKECEKAGHKISAGEIYLRAGNYYQAALHRYPVAGGDRVRDLSARAVSCYADGLTLTEKPVEMVRIPFENTTLPGYFFPAPDLDQPAPTLLVQQGRDGWLEHLFYIAEAATARGYNCLLFAGPGQARVLRLQGLSFRPDWENVVGPVVDFVLERPEVDPERLGLIGLSMGGSLAPRAAAFEKRLAACVANPGVLDWPGVMFGYIAQLDPELETLWQTDPAAFNRRIEAVCETSKFWDWGLKDTMWKHGVTSPAAMMADMNRYSNVQFVHQISCPTLVMDGEADVFSQGKDLYEALDCPKDYIMFTAEDTGLEHCQVGALRTGAQRMLDWLDDNL